MKNETLPESPSRRTLVSAILEKLEKDMDSARNGLEEIGDSVTTEQLGTLYIVNSSEIEGLYISSLHGEVDLYDGWYVSFEELATKLLEEIDTIESLKGLIKGFKKVTSILEKDLQEDLRKRAKGERPV